MPPSENGAYLKWGLLDYPKRRTVSKKSLDVFPYDSDQFPDGASKTCADDVYIQCLTDISRCDGEVCIAG